jgi:hypothetical protein
LNSAPAHPDEPSFVFSMGTKDSTQASLLAVAYIWASDTVRVYHGKAVFGDLTGAGLAQRRGAWTHVAVRFSRGAGASTAEILIDGTVAGSANILSEINDPGPENAYVMLGGTRTNHMFFDPEFENALRADLDDVRLWVGHRTPAGIIAGLAGDLRGPHDEMPSSPCVVDPDTAHGNAQLVMRLLFDECPSGPVRAGPLYEPTAGHSHGIEACNNVPVVHRSSPAAKVERFELANPRTRDARDAVATIVIRDALMHVRDGYLDAECATLSFVVATGADPRCAAGVDAPTCNYVRLSHHVDASVGGCAWGRPAHGSVAARVRIPFLTGLTNATVLAVMGPTGFPNGADVYSHGYFGFEEPGEVTDGIALPDTGPNHTFAQDDPVLRFRRPIMRRREGFAALADTPDRTGAFVGQRGIGIGSYSPGVEFHRRRLAPTTGSSMCWSIMMRDDGASLGAGLDSAGYWGAEGHSMSPIILGGIAAAIGFHQSHPDHYSYYHVTANFWQSTGVPRSVGWHKLEYTTEVLNNGSMKVSMLVDGIAVGGFFFSLHFDEFFLNSFLNFFFKN